MIYPETMKLNEVQYGFRVLSLSIWKPPGNPFRRRPAFLVFLIPALLLWPGTARACMVAFNPYELTSFGKEHLLNFSFFVALMLFATLAVNRTTEFFRRDFSKLPKLGFFKSFLIVGGAGVLFHLALSPFMDTRHLTHNPSEIKTEDIEKRLNESLPVLDKKDIEQQNFKAILIELSNPQKSPQTEQ